MKLSVVIPVYNEAQTIGEVVDRVWAVDLGDIEREVIVNRVSYHTCQSP
jgi:glycosyltransferase involved in cell wall biosynthesis